MNNPTRKNMIMRLWHALFPANSAKRSYASAKVNRLNAGWATYPTGANHEARDSLNALIARSRQAARDDLHIVNYLRLMRENVIGSEGIQLQLQAKRKNGKLNVKLNERVAMAWWEWCHAETCTVSGKLDWKGVQDLALTQVERDGAFLVQMVEADNEYGFSLRLWDVTWLDLSFNEITRDGNRVIMSIEVDSNNKPVAYWLTTPSNEVTFTREQSRIRRRIPAKEMIHGFYVMDDESQLHGIPGTAAALLPAKNALGYCEGVVTQARVAANTFAVLENTVPDGDSPGYDGREDGEGNVSHPYIESSPLSITPLLPGWQMKQFDPKQPTQNHTAFKETLDADIAVALGVPYFLLMQNWKAVNFSSSRGGLGEFRQSVKSKQRFIATALGRQVFNSWLTAAWLKGKIELRPEEYKELLNPAWQGRGFDYIEPQKDINADVTKLQNRLATPSQILAQRGVDYPDFLDRWESDKKLAASKGIDIDTLYSVTPIAPPQSEDEDQEKENDLSGNTLENKDDRSYSNGIYAN